MSAAVTAAVTVSGGGRARPDLPLSRRELAGLSTRILAELGLADMAVEVAAVSEQDMARLHHRFLGRTGPTNVLSFPAGQQEAGALAPVMDPVMDAAWQADPEVGLVVISGDTVMREARLYGQDPTEHLARLLAHAFLHLAGLEHGPDMEAATQAAVAAVAGWELN